MCKNICKREIYSSYQAFYKKLSEDPSYSPEKEYSSQDLQKILECSKSTLSDIMKHLLCENADYINRRITGRSYYYQFIPLGKELIEVSEDELLMLNLCRICSEASSELTGNEETNLVTQLNKLLTYILKDMKFDFIENILSELAEQLLSNNSSMSQEYEKMIEIIKAFTLKKICIINSEGKDSKVVISKFGMKDKKIRACIHFFTENNPNTLYGQQYEYLYDSIKSPKCTDISHLQDIEKLKKENEDKQKLSLMLTI